jgi:prevent-host-death family protein
MQRTVSATEARVHFGEIVRRVAKSDETVVVERAGEPQVVVLSMRAYQRLTAQGDGDARRAAFRAALATAARIQRKAGRRPLPAPEDVIREGREERAAALDRAARQRR